MNNQTENETMVLSSDYSKAFKLNQHIKFHAEMAQISLYEMCKGLKEMRDGKLYKELGYQNFEEYSEKEIGIKYRQAYSFCLIAEKFSEENLQSIAGIGTTKLALLARLEEPQRDEIVQNTDLESVTVKELKQKIKSLEDSLSWQRDRTSELDKAKSKLFTENTRNEVAVKKLTKQIKELQIDHAKVCHNLKEQIQELENRPVEVAVEKDTEEIERLTTQIQGLQSHNDKLFSDRERLTDSLAEETRKRYDLIEQLEQEQKAHKEEIDRIKSGSSHDDAVLSEIKAYKKVAENSLHNLFTAILRQETFSREYLGSSMIEMLETYMKLFKFEDDSDR